MCVISACFLALGQQLLVSAADCCAEKEPGVKSDDGGTQ